MKFLWKNGKGRMGGRKKTRFWMKTEGEAQREGEAGFRNQSARISPGSLPAVLIHDTVTSRTGLTGLLVRLNLAKLCNMLTRYSPAAGALWVRVEVSWGVQTSRIWTGERQREDCRCRNNVNKGLEVGSTHFNPVVGLGAKHRKHGHVMNKHQSGDRS